MLRTELPRRGHAKGKGILLVISSEKLQRTKLHQRKSQQCFFSPEDP